MRKNTTKFIIPLILLLIIGATVVNSFVLRAREQRNKELLAAKILQDQIAAKKAVEDAAEKIYLLGKFDPAEREDFLAVPAKYNVAGYKTYLRKETLEAFTRMAEAAEKDGVALNIASATRNFDYQKDLWNKKWEGITLVDNGKLPKTVPDELERFKKILEYSAVPGTSRHHWGTDIDIYSAIPEYFNTEKGEKIYDWLMRNAPSFGFCQPYTLKGSARPTGYNEEKWHWSYLPLSRKFTEDYKNLITMDDIRGFDGDEYVKNFDLINNYVLDINPECLYHF